jgi:hypothetical protein
LLHRKVALFLFLVVPVLKEDFMTQSDLDREVSRATGETLGTVRRHGFSLLPLPDDCGDDEPHVLPLRIVDWDAVDQRRRHAA